MPSATARAVYEAHRPFYDSLQRAVKAAVDEEVDAGARDPDAAREREAEGSKLGIAPAAVKNCWFSGGTTTGTLPRFSSASRATLSRTRSAARRRQPGRCAS